MGLEVPKRVGVLLHCVPFEIDRSAAVGEIPIRIPKDINPASVLGVESKKVRGGERE